MRMDGNPLRYEWCLLEKVTANLIECGQNGVFPLLIFSEQHKKAVQHLPRPRRRFACRR